MDSNFETKKTEDNYVSHEPIFNNMPFGTIFLLALILIIQFARSFEPDGEISTLVIISAIIPQRIEELKIMGANNFITYWPFIGYQFLHAGTFHVIMNSGMLIQAGPIAELGFVKGANIVNYKTIKKLPHYNKVRIRAAILFILFFIICGIGSALGFLAFNKEPNVILMGASGSISGIFAGFLWSAYHMAPKGTPIFKLISGSAIMFLIINVGGAAIARVTNFIPIAWEAHLFGFLTGLVFYPIFYKFSRQ